MFPLNQSEKIQIFRPTWEEFKDFPRYVAYMESCDAHKAGLAKVVPPVEWVPRKSGYENLDALKIQIADPIFQVVSGKEGLYQQVSVLAKPLTLEKFRMLANRKRFATPNHLDNDELELKYWEKITSLVPVYGADVSGSLTDIDQESWNISKLGSILDLVNEDYGMQIEGVNTPYLYFGMWKSSFAWHTEDMDLNSINHLHFGAPKSWYAVPPSYGHKFESVANSLFPASFKNCSAYLRHKTTLIHPDILQQHGVPVQKITQQAGEIIITFPFGYHSGYNHGFNCAESSNFATERWIEYGKRAIHCHCGNMVTFPMNGFVKRFQPDKYEAWLEGCDMGHHPENPADFCAAPKPTHTNVLNEGLDSPIHAADVLEKSTRKKFLQKHPDLNLQEIQENPNIPYVVKKSLQESILNEAEHEDEHEDAPLNVRVVESRVKIEDTFAPTPENYAVEEADSSRKRRNKRKSYTEFFVDDEDDCLFKKPSRASSRKKR